MEKRIVLRTTTGRFAGQYRICGLESALSKGDAPWPKMVTPVQFRDHRGSASFTRAGKSYILYTEVADGVGEQTQIESTP